MLGIELNRDNALGADEQLGDLLSVITPDLCRDQQILDRTVRKVQRQLQRRDQATDVAEVHKIKVLLRFERAIERITLPGLELLAKLVVLVAIFVSDGELVVLVIQIAQHRRALDQAATLCRTRVLLLQGPRIVRLKLTACQRELALGVLT